jgi:hypothetical protein
VPSGYSCGRSIFRNQAGRVQAQGPAATRILPEGSEGYNAGSIGLAARPLDSRTGVKTSSANTVTDYQGCRRAARRVRRRSEDTDGVAAIRRQHIEALIADAIDRFKPGEPSLPRLSAVLQRPSSASGELKVSPKARMKPPRTPVRLPSGSDRRLDRQA